MKTKLLALSLSIVLFLSLVALFAWISTEADEGDIVVASLSTPRNSHSATLLLDGSVLVAGGWDGVKAVANADLYDPRTQAWVATHPLDVARVYHAAARLPDGRVLVTGG